MSPLLSTFSGMSARGYRWNRVISPYVPYTGATPEYWWRADYGLSTSTWKAYAGGIDISLVNVTSANGITGIYFNGTSGYGITASGFGVNTDVRHIMIRFDVLIKPAENAGLISLTGGTVATNHEAFAYQNQGGFYWYFLEYTDASTLTYAVRGTNGGGDRLVWADFINGGENLDVYLDDSTAQPHTAYLGTFVNRMRWAAGTNFYIGRRDGGNYANVYIKEVALFTSLLGSVDAAAFRNNMNARWP